MKSCIVFYSLLLFVSPVCSSLADGLLPVNSQSDIIQIRSVTIDNKPVGLVRGEKVTLKADSKHVMIYFGPGTNSSHVPIRLRYKLDGYDNAWREDPGEVCLFVRYFNESQNQIGQDRFSIDGHTSPGWQTTLKNSSLTHRRESVVVPPHASQLMIVIASTGAPSNVGVYVVTDLVVSRITPNGQPEVLLSFPAVKGENQDMQNGILRGWTRDGTHPSMAGIAELGDTFSSKKAFVILDDDAFAHAEWRNTIESAPRVMPGDHILIEWNEMYNIADSLTRYAGYDSLPPGEFNFHVEELNVLGIPTGVEVSLPIFVSQPAWKRPWFWIVAFIGLSALGISSTNYILRRRMRLKISRLESQRVLEKERLRIARDIHDDLGARVTLISLVSAMASGNPIDPEKARVDFEQISQMSRDLVAALYETVWAVNPANDNLKELGNFLSQLANKLCLKTQCRCRFYVDELPREIIISSHVRHNICMAVKEALHNVIRHANASEVAVRIYFKNSLLEIVIHDNGCGFRDTDKFAGAGLSNLKHRLSDIGGSCVVESEPGQGTTIRLGLGIAAHAQHDSIN
jgi:signal transduction histidine kinase